MNYQTNIDIASFLGSSKKYLFKGAIVLFLLLFSINVFSQDTLIYKDGKIKPVKITAYDDILKLLRYKEDTTTFIIPLSSLKDYKLHSELDSKISVIQTSIRDTSFIAGNSCKFTYSRFSFGINPILPIRIYNKYGIFDYMFNNSKFLFFGEYLSKNRRFGLRIPITFGINNDISRPGANFRGHFIFESGIQTNFNIPKYSKKVFSYTGIGLYTGKVNLNVLESRYSYDSTTYYYTYQTNIVSKKDYNFFRVNMVYGILFNIYKNLNFGIENSISIYTKKRYGNESYYSNNGLYGSGPYFEFSSFFLGRFNYVFEFHLIYRMGGKKVHYSGVN